MTGKSPPVTTSITSPPATLTKIMSNILSLERQNIRKWGEYSVIFGSENDRIFPSCHHLYYESSCDFDQNRVLTFLKKSPPARTFTLTPDISTMKSLY